MDDKYDEQIEQIVADRSLAREQWMGWDGFFGAVPNGNVCLTMIRRPDYDYFESVPALFREIHADSRIPSSVEDLQAAINAAETDDGVREILKPFAEWRRKLDAGYTGEATQ